MSKVLYKAGYTVRVTSWENDGDNYKTVDFHVGEKEKVDVVVKFANLFISNSNNPSGIGNLSDDEGFKAHYILGEFYEQNMPWFCADIDLDGVTDEDEENEIIGDCMLDFAYDLGLSGRVFFHTSNAQKQEVIQQAHVGVLPTLSEGYSNALMEYMAAGLPVLASDILANRDVLGSDYASAFFKNTAESLATAVLELMHNEALRQEMGKANRHRILKLHRFDPANQWPFSNQAVHYFDLNENQEYQ